MIKQEPVPEIRLVFLLATLITVLSSVPYLYGLAITPPGYSFLGLTHNIDDAAVYLSWMRQAADGHFFIRNLFTNERQNVLPFNVFFLLLGNIGRIAHIPLVWTYHICRVVLGICLVVVAWKFSRLFLEQQRDRLIFATILGASSGLGWLIGYDSQARSIDLWQPEAITFLSVYLNPLFLIGQILMIGAFYWLIMSEREGQTRYAVYAGLALLLLGNIHSYDVVTVAFVWIAYIFVSAALVRERFLRNIKLSIIAALIGIPSIAYQFYIYSTNPVYRARANSPAPSAELYWLFSGYGLVLLGAILGMMLSVRDLRRSAFNLSLFLIVWSIVGFAIPYIPIAQQRKLIMGLHIPLCILCAYALGRFLHNGGWTRTLAIVFFVAATIPSNILFLHQDIELLSQADTAPRYAPFMSKYELSAMRWLHKNTKVDDTILAPPTFALFVPAMIGHQVYYGHWSETPNYAIKRNEWAYASLALSEGELLSGDLGKLGVRYLVHYKALKPINPPPELVPVFENHQVIVYRCIYTNSDL
jgi:hypothetical protein